MRKIFLHKSTSEQLELMKDVIQVDFTDLFRFFDQTGYLYFELQEKSKQLIPTITQQNEIAELVKNALEEQRDLLRRIKPHLFNTTLVSCVSLFEILLKEICEFIIDVGEVENKKVRREKSYIKKLKLVLTEIIKIDLSPKEALWDKIQLYSIIRNKIVHQICQLKIVDERERQLSEKIKKLNGIKIIKDTPAFGKIVIHDVVFLKDYIKSAQEYLNFVVDMLLEKQKSM